MAQIIGVGEGGAIAPPPPPPPTFDGSVLLHLSYCYRTSVF